PGDELNNVLDGGAGTDTLIGGAGNDTYYVDNGGDSVVETTGGGIDTVVSTVSYTLPAEVEILVLNGNAQTGFGNALNNTITGNGTANVMSGGAGNDTLDG